MPSLARDEYIIDGIGLATPLHKGEYNTISAGKFYVIGDDGNPVGSTAVVIANELSVYFMKTFDVSAGSTYNIYGQCSPAGSTVHISSNFIQNNVPSLTENIEFSIESDEDGQFAFNGVDGVDGTIAVWIHVGMEYLQTSGIACECISTNINADNRRLVYSDFFSLSAESVCPTCNGTGHSNDNCSRCGGTGVLNDNSACPDCKCATCNGSGVVTLDNPEYKFNGSTSPEIDNVYLSFYEHTNTPNVDTLTNNLLATSVTTNESTCSICSGTGALENGSTCENCGGDGIHTLTDTRMYEFSSTVTGVGHYYYIIWGLTTKPENEHAYVSHHTAILTNGKAVCLSGDTMILMADGSNRRLDELVEGDMVMSEDLSPTMIKTLARGHFNPYHTKYCFEDGTTIDEIHAHRFYNVEQGFWQRLGNWKLGEHAVRQNGSRIALVSVERIDESAEMFGIWTESGTYYANGLLSGDASCNRSLLTDATAEQTVDMMLSMEENDLLSLIGLGEVLP